MRPLARTNRERSDCRVVSLSRAFFLFLPFSLFPSSCPLSPPHAFILCPSYSPALYWASISRVFFPSALSFYLFLTSSVNMLYKTVLFFFRAESAALFPDNLLSSENVHSYAAIISRRGLSYSNVSDRNKLSGNIGLYQILISF